jgi:hypothetical protein
MIYVKVAKTGVQLLVSKEKRSDYSELRAFNPTIYNHFKLYLQYKYFITSLFNLFVNN